MQGTCIVVRRFKPYRPRKGNSLDAIAFLCEKYVSKSLQILGFKLMGNFFNMDNFYRDFE